MVGHLRTESTSVYVAQQDRINGVLLTLDEARRIAARLKLETASQIMSPRLCADGTVAELHARVALAERSVGVLEKSDDSSQ